eukprot:Clim_evm77s142 gene=Clim_evmTU77s142
MPATDYDAGTSGMMDPTMRASSSGYSDILLGFEDLKRTYRQLVNKQRADIRELEEARELRDRVEVLKADLEMTKNELGTVQRNEQRLMLELQTRIQQDARAGAEVNSLKAEIRSLQSALEQERTRSREAETRLARFDKQMAAIRQFVGADTLAGMGDLGTGDDIVDSGPIMGGGVGRNSNTGMGKGYPQSFQSSMVPQQQQAPQSAMMNQAHLMTPGGLGLNNSLNYPNSGLESIKATPSSSFNAGYHGSRFARRDSDLLGDQGLPDVVETCIREVERRGLRTEGLYRASAPAGQIDRLLLRFAREIPDLSQVDIHVVTGTLKRYLRELPEPLLSHVLYKDFLNVARIENPVARVGPMYQLINRLPRENRITLNVLMLHLHRLSEKNAVNKMTPRNLAKALAPVLMHAKVGYHANTEDATLQNRVIETLIEQMPIGTWR